MIYSVKIELEYFGKTQSVRTGDYAPAYKSNIQKLCDIKDWLEEQNITHVIGDGDIRTGFVFDFFNPHDAVLFKVTWM